MALGTSLPARIGTPSLRTFYVDGATGNDADSGLTEALAWATFTKALATVQAGDLVRVKTGTYTSTSIYQWTPPTGRRGTVANPIQFEAFDPANKPVLRGSASNAQCLNIQATGTLFPEYTRFKNLIFEKHASATNTYKLVELWQSGAAVCSHIDFDGCVFRNGTGQGLFIRYGTLDVQVWNCELNNNGTGDGAGLGHNSYIMGTDHVIAQNIFRDATNGYCFQLWSEEEIQNIIVVNNIADDAGNGGGFGFGGEAGGTVDDNRVYNNIFTNNSDAAINAYNDGLNSCTGNTATNNLGFGNGASPQFYTDNNVLAANTSALVAANLSGNPLYVNVGANDFHITNIASPAYDAGVETYTPVLDRDGLPRSQPDLGPYRIATGAAPSGGRRRGTTLGVR